jgi:hypothetical protein
MNHWTSIATPLLVAALLTLQGAPARADSPDAASEAEARITHGLALRRERRDAEALAEFRRAFALAQSGRALAQVALAEDAVGLWVEAEQTFEEVLARQGDPWIEKRRAQLGDELRELQAHLADVELEIAPENAEVWINGASARRSAATGAFRVVSGRAFVEVKAEGFEPVRRVFEVPPGTRVHDSIALEPTRISRGDGEDDPAARPQMRVAGTGAGAVVPGERQAPSGTNVRRVLAFSALAAAGSALLVGGAAATVREVDVGRYNDNSQCFYGNEPRAMRCAGVAADVNRYTTIMVAGFAASAVAGVLGQVLLLTAPRGNVRVEVSSTGRDGPAVWVTGRF